MNIRTKSCALLVLLCLSCAPLQRGDDQIAKEGIDGPLSEEEKLHKYRNCSFIGSQSTIQPDLWAELRHLRDMVVDQKVQLEVAQFLLQHNQNQIKQLEKDDADMKRRLLVCESQVEMLNTVSSDLVERVASTERTVETIINTPKVAFSFASGYSGHVGPFNIATILVFSREITNIGNAYSPITGIFTAPVRGVYYFRFNIFGNSDWMSAHICKNHENLLMVSERADGENEYASAATSVLLEKGDVVYVKLVQERQIYDDSSNHSSFSGFLLFPV